MVLLSIAYTTATKNTIKQIVLLSIAYTPAIKNPIKHKL